jgi:hypothetical protein
MIAELAHDVHVIGGLTYVVSADYVGVTELLQCSQLIRKQASRNVTPDGLKHDDLDG